MALLADDGHRLDHAGDLDIGTITLSVFAEPIEWAPGSRSADRSTLANGIGYSAEVEAGHSGKRWLMQNQSTLRTQDSLQSPPTPSRRARIDAVDALRGFALCGILLVNIPPLVHLAALDGTGDLFITPELLDLLVQQRFFPIFSFLFGFSFALFFESADARSDRPRLVLIRRLAALALLGGAHQVLQPGEALLPYAIVGIAFLVPSTWTPRWLVLGVGAAATIGSVVFLDGGVTLIPGLFLLGAAAVRYALPQRLTGRGLGLAFALALPAAAAAVLWQVQTATSVGGQRAAAIAGLLVAFVYVTGFALLMRTGLRRPLAAGLSPLGRMALTNYVSATLIVLAAAHPLGLHDSEQWGTAMALAVGILLAQSIASRAWLARFRYGPLEWAWRSVTWWERVPLRRNPARQSERRA
jgi:uncharacterized membrane protein YeiB